MVLAKTNPPCIALENPFLPCLSRFSPCPPQLTYTHPRLPVSCHQKQPYLDTKERAIISNIIMLALTMGTAGYAIKTLFPSGLSHPQYKMSL